MEIKEFLEISPIGIPVIMALMFVIKSYEPLKKYIPVIAMLLWVLIVFVINWWWEFGFNAYQVFMIGIVLWWTATGVYEAWKNIIKE